MSDLAGRPAVLGLPFDGASSFLRGPASAPSAIRRVLHAGSANYWSELGIEVDPADWDDLGDLDLSDSAAEAIEPIAAAVAELRRAGRPVLSLGGDHFVTYPILRGLAAAGDRVTIVHVDAHPDLYDELDGDRLSHACPFARIMEEGLAERLIQFGIRTTTGHQREQIERFGVECFEVRTWDGSVPEIDGPVYVTIDVDGLDPAYAPGVSHHEPGGLTTREVLDVLHTLHGRGVEVVGADVVEVNPDRDIHDMTAMVGAKFVRELLALMR